MFWGFMSQKAKVVFNVADKKITLILRDGFREDSPIIENSNENCYFLKKGIYSYDVLGPNICSVHKVFTVPEEALGEILTINISVLPLEGREAEFKGPVFLYSDELEEKLYDFSQLMDSKEVVFDTPSFDKSKKMHQFATNEEKKSYVRSVLTSCDHGIMNEDYYSFPIVFFSQNHTFLTGTPQQILEKFEKSGKLNVFYHAQIHGNETASGEGALVMIKKMAGSFGKMLLEKMNLVVVPCVNQQGNANQVRECNGMDLNRDFLTVTSKEVQDLHRIFYLLRPEIVIDGHTYTRANSFKEDNIKKALFDIRMSSSNTLNMEKSLVELGENLVEHTLEGCRKTGFRCGYYGTSVNTHASRSYYSLSPCCSILVETEGTRTAKYHFRRNVWAQCKAITILLEDIYEKANDIKVLMISEREKVKNYQGLYRERYITKHKRSGNKKYVTKVVNYDFFGGIKKNDDEIVFVIFDQAEKSVKMQEKYIVDSSQVTEKQMIFLKSVHGIEWYSEIEESGRKIFVVPGNQPQIQVFLELILKEILVI